MDVDDVASLIEQMGDLLKLSLTDAEKNDKGNSAAGVRVRKHMQDVKALAQTVRERVLYNREQKALGS
tara:strand:- start:1720 stop:1923 length:204 start_codon:yes stop_codon:yes gene_type:complete